MENTQIKALKIIVKTSRKSLANELGIDHRTLMKRIDKGGWLDLEIEKINKLYGDL